MEKKEQNKMSLHAFVDLCTQFEDDPTEKNQQLIEDFLGQLVIREYMPSAEKSLHAVSIVSRMTLDYDAPGATTILETYKIVEGLFSYVINLEDDIPLLSNTYSAIDMFFQHGLIDTILQVCSKDYYRFTAYCDSLINVNSIQYLIQTSELLNTAEYDKWTKSLENLRKSLKPEFLKALASYSVANNEDMNEVRKTLGARVLDSMDREYANSQVSVEQISKDLKQGAAEYEGEPLANTDKSEA